MMLEDRVRTSRSPGCSSISYIGFWRLDDLSDEHNGAKFLEEAEAFGR